MSDITTITVTNVEGETLNPVTATITVVGTVPAGPPGAPGDAGAAGEDGASAYEVAVAEGFVGDEAAWLASLVGEQGEPGSDADATALVAAEAATRAAADTALDGRVDTLEAVDPVLSVVAGDNVTIDDTDPQNPIISAEAGGGGGTVESVVAGTNIDVDSTDPANPVVSLETLVDADIPASIARDSEVTAAVDAEATIRAAADTALDGRLDTLEAVDNATQAELNAHAADTTAVHGIADTSVLETTTGAQAKADAAQAAATAASQPLDGDLTTLAAAGNSAVLAASTASFLIADETKLDGIEAGAQVNPTTEVLQDVVGAMVSGGTETGIAVTYDDTNGRLDFVAEVTQTELDAAVAGILDGFTATGDIIVPDEAYDATTWNGSLEVPTKNAVRDKIETLGGGGYRMIDEDTVIVSSGNKTLDQSNVTNLTDTQVTLAGAQVGDIVYVSPSMVFDGQAQYVTLDAYTYVSGTRTNPFGPGVSSGMSGAGGYSGWFIDAFSALLTASGPARRVLVSGDISGGNVTVGMAYAKLNTTARTLIANANNPIQVTAQLWRPG